MQATDASRRFPYHDFAYHYHRHVEGKIAMIRKGPWTSEEDAKLIDCITLHGEGRWDSLACLAGLKRTGKSCRLRWLNYLRPNLRRGSLTIQEQLLILKLHSCFGNRWSRIAKYLPGRTDNEIKNYWRTRVQKQARQLNCDVNSQQFTYKLRSLWIPRLMEQLSAASPRIHVQSSNYGDHNSYSTGMGMTADQTSLGAIFTSYKPHQLQQRSSSAHVPPVWNDLWESPGSNKCNLEEGLVCPLELLSCSLHGGTDFLEFDNQPFVHTELFSGSPNIYAFN